jgi:3-hydroxyacyl-CoA dehydrogenase
VRRQSVEKGKMTKEAADQEFKAIDARIKYSTDLNDLKDVDLVIEVRLACALP